MSTILDGKSKEQLQQNIADLRQLFPEVCCEDKIDFDKLKQILGEYVDDNKERYNFTWNGKGQAIKLSQTPSMGTLRPYPGEEESKNWDTTENLYIEGDNLEVLKLLQKSYYGKVKMIYIDPPYNTEEDFIYNDDFSDSIKKYKEITNQMDESGFNISTTLEKSGRHHTNWLNMMYPRLRIARQLLSDDGVVFISINDIEVDNLQKLCNEIFGENNHTATFLWTKTATPPALSAKCRKSVEYVLVYEKNISPMKYYGGVLAGGDAPLLNTGNTIKKLIFPPESIQVKFLENGTIPATETAKVTIHNDVIVQNGKNHNGVEISGEFKWEQATLDKELKQGTYIIAKTNNFSLRFQRKIGDDAFKTPKNFIDIELNIKEGVGTNESANKELEHIGMGKYFDYPKPISLLNKIEKMITQYDKDALILDFFSGSATTAHAVMQLNAEDGGNRRFIMVQLPEPCAEKTEAYKAGYQNICEIGKERIRRAGEKIKQEIEAENAQLKMGEDPKKVPDIGFKVFKLDSSNLKKWQPDYDDFNQSLLDSIDNYVEGRTELDVVYEIMLKMGLELTYPLATCTVKDKNIYVIAYGALMICLDHEITTDVAHEMIRLHEEYQPEIWQVVFKDNGFASDSVKTNIKEMLKVAGLDEDAFTTI